MGIIRSNGQSLNFQFLYKEVGFLKEIFSSFYLFKCNIFYIRISKDYFYLLLFNDRKNIDLASTMFLLASAHSNKVFRKILRSLAPINKTKFVNKLFIDIIILLDWLKILPMLSLSNILSPIKGREKQLMMEREKEYTDLLDFLRLKKFESKNIRIGLHPGHNKKIFQISTKSGEILGFGKICKDSIGKSSLKNSTDKLRKLSNYDFDCGIIPRVICEGEYKNNYILVVSAVEANTFRSLSLEKYHINFLAELMSKTGASKQIRKARIFNNIISNLEAVLGTGQDFEELQWILERFYVICDGINHKQIPFGFCHQDFEFKNTFKSNKKIYVIDWEWSEDDYPPFFDCFNYILYSHPAKKERNFTEKVKKQLFEQSHNAEMITKYARLIKIDDKSISYSLFLLYLINRIVLHFCVSKQKSIPQKEFNLLQQLLENKYFSYNDWLGDGSS